MVTTLKRQLYLSRNKPGNKKNIELGSECDWMKCVNRAWFKGLLSVVEKR